jgi:thiamine biosynthesis protein ThiI
MGVILKRMMLRAATEVANELEIPALVTGESVAQVSSQTLANLVVIDSAVDKLVLRPLIASDKNDIIHLSQQIGTEQFAASMPEYCGVISVKPTTRAKPEKIEAEESRFDFSVLEQAIANKRAVNIDEIVNDAKEDEPLKSISKVQAGDTVIDIRHPDESKTSPLILECEVMCIPFYSMHRQYQQLDREKTYWLYCDKGIMSQLHAGYLKQQGIHNIGIYQPGN